MLAFLIQLPTPVFACDNNIPGYYLNRYVDNNDGTITDKMTNLMWQKCTLGAVWNNQSESCEVDGDELKILKFEILQWRDALERARQNDFASHSDWRLPNVKELASIVTPACMDTVSTSAIELSIFDYAYMQYWSSTPTRRTIRVQADAETSTYKNTAYAVAFGTPFGRTGASISSIEEEKAVRLVRNR